MTRDAQDLLRQALQLSDAERAEIAGVLLESLEPPADADVEEAWRREVERRLRAIDAGEGEWVPWEDVREQLLARLSDRA
jgi:putative addiction module component (TIGR02574 family)